MIDWRFLVLFGLIYPTMQNFFFNVFLENNIFEIRLRSDRKVSLWLSRDLRVTKIRILIIFRITSNMLDSEFFIPIIPERFLFRTGRRDISFFCRFLSLKLFLYFSPVTLGLCFGFRGFLHFKILLKAGKVLQITQFLCVTLQINQAFIFKQNRQTIIIF